MACSLCEKLSLTVYKGTKMYTQDYVKGIAQHELLVHVCEEKPGMEIILIPDQAIFGDATFSKALIEQWISGQKQKNDNLQVEVIG